MIHYETSAMTNRSPFLSRRKVMAGALLAPAAAIVASAAATGMHGLLFGQPAPKIPSFEIASVKANLIHDPSDPRYTGLTDYVPQRSGDRISMRNSQLRSIVAWAYHLTNPDYQLVAGRWEKSLWEDSYDIEALTTGSPGDDDLRRMFQTLLEERFELKSHWETRELPVYDLVVVRSRSKLTPAPPRPVKNSLGFGGSSSWVEIGDGGLRLVGKGASMDELAVVLTGKMNAPVRDRTGLAGAFDYNVVFSSGVDASEAPVLTTAIRELGLSLKKGKGKFAVLVIDQLAKPSEN
jgi:uncharacterized protein (TIGR03435 family)